jgi:hypothetical protein
MLLLCQLLWVQLLLGLLLEPELLLLLLLWASVLLLELLLLLLAVWHPHLPAPLHQQRHVTDA